MNPSDELAAAVEAILSSSHGKRLVVAGPGAGKTSLFRKILERLPGEGRRLVFTFINNLKADLERDLGAQAEVYTFHGLCKRLLHAEPGLRGGLSNNFLFFPFLEKVIARDWKITRKEAVPEFAQKIRRLEEGPEIVFYKERANYYDAVGFDDSVLRVYEGLQENPETLGGHEVVLVDEFQDFNLLEVEFIKLLADRNPIVIAGDDDQALYVDLRSSDPQFIRDLHGGGVFSPFSLPFSMRCTEVIVNAYDDMVGEARRQGCFAARLPKEYRYFPPAKAGDSARYPLIQDVCLTTQGKGNANYMGRYVAEQIALIPAEEILESNEKGFSTVLVVGPGQYVKPIKDWLERAGFPCEGFAERPEDALTREAGLEMLKADQASNLGWRLVIEVDQPSFYRDVIRRSVGESTPIAELLPEKYRSEVLSEAAEYEPASGGSENTSERTADLPTIRCTTFEGSKGLSAQHVFVVGLHEEDVPRRGALADLEVCRFLVAITRTRKQCHLLHALHWYGTEKRPSRFLRWVKPARKASVSVNKSYWTSRA